MGKRYTKEKERERNDIERGERQIGKGKRYEKEI